MLPLVYKMYLSLTPSSPLALSSKLSLAANAFPELSPSPHARCSPGSKFRNSTTRLGKSQNPFRLLITEKYKKSCGVYHFPSNSLLDNPNISERATAHPNQKEREKKRGEVKAINEILPLP